MRLRNVCGLIAALALVGATHGFPQPEQPGPSLAGWTQQTIQRGSRSLNCRVYYPALVEGSEAPIDTLHAPYPIFAFGHGFFMQTSYYLSHFRHLATHGYVVIAPQFPDTQHGELADDLLFCVDYIRLQHANPSSRFFGLIDTARVGLSGHSMGGGASLLAASRDPRVAVVVPLAAAETNPSAIAAMPLIQGFVYLIAGGSDGITPPAQHQIPMYNAARPVKGLPIINGANHTRFMDFAGFDFTDPNGNLTRAEQLLITRRYITSALNLVLKQDPSFWIYTFGDSATGDPRLTFSWTGKPLVPFAFEQIAPSGSIQSLPVEFRWRKARTLNPSEPITYSVRVWNVLNSTLFPNLPDTTALLTPPLWPQILHSWEVVAWTSDSTFKVASAPLSFTLTNCLEPMGSARIVILDAGMTGDSLFFGFDSLATCGEDQYFCEWYLVEPCGPPTGLFCAYWYRPCTIGEPDLLRLNDIRRYRHAAAVDTHQLRFYPGDAGYPITLRWSSQEVSAMCDSAVLVDVFGGILHRQRMDLTDSMVVTNPGISWLNIIRYGQRISTTSVDETASVPLTLDLLQNYPNPFNPSTTLTFGIHHSAFVILKVYDILGREVATLVNERKEPGIHRVEFNAEGLPSGVYLSRIHAEAYTASRKMLLLR